jgi:hypothetical protein
MSEQIKLSELKAMIANAAKEKGLEKVLDIEKITQKVKQRVELENAKKSIPQEISEVSNPELPQEIGKFPTEVNMDKEEIQNMPNPEVNSPTPVDMGTTGNIPAYTPELPSFMDKIGPAKIVVFSQNELSEGGENLSNKPLRTFENPDVKKSMHDFWVEEGKKTAEVYIAKFEKIGEINFDFSNGTSVFTEKRFEPDFQAQAKYKENPYAAESKPVIITPAGPVDASNLQAQIATSVDLEKVVTDLVINILRNQLLTNSEKATVINPVTAENAATEPYGYSKAQAVKPMEEGFKLTMFQVVEERNGFEKIDTPEALRESIEKNENKFLSRENESVQEWVFEGKTFYTAKNKISAKKCYTLKEESKNSKKSLL